MNFQSITNAIAAQFGLDNLEQDDDGLVQLEYNGGITLTLFSPAQSSAIYLAASLMELPTVTSPAFLERLLKMNFLLLDTRGAALSIDEDSRQVHLCLCLPFALIDETSLAGLVVGFLETASQLQSELMAGEAAVVAQGASRRTQAPTMQRI
jgi:hypothetical protein